jgi:hypothetical protein
MKRLLFSVLLIAAVATAAQVSPLKRLQAKVAVQPVRGLSLKKLAGQYLHPAKELGVGLTGDDLYLFPDGTYVFAEWGDVQPTVVRDKGKWKIANNLVQLASDADVRWSPGAERKYLAVHRSSQSSEVLLVGTEDALSSFETNAKSEPEIELLVVSKERKTAIRMESATSVKRELMVRYWQPDYFLNQRRLGKP